VLALDGLDEVEEHLRPQAAESILAAVSRWPGHQWLVTFRPCEEVQTLTDVGFTSFHILPSRRWARKYLETRSVPQDRIEQAMLHGYGLGDLLGIPLFAARLADRLLEGVIASYRTCDHGAFSIDAHPNHRGTPGFRGASSAGPRRALQRTARHACSRQEQERAEGPGRLLVVVRRGSPKGVRRHARIHTKVVVFATTTTSVKSVLRVGA
jgi:hypothetical protein